METISSDNNANNIIDIDISNKSIEKDNRNSYKGLLKISLECYKELKLILFNKKILSKDDIIVLNDIITNVNSFSLEIISNGNILEAANLNQICLKIINILLKILNLNVPDDQSKNQIDFLMYPFSLKLAVLEIKFHLVFMVEKNYIESEMLLLEIISIQNVLKLPIYNRGSSKFYLAILKFFSNNIEQSESLALEALKILESNTKEIPYDDTQKSTENKTTHKMSVVLEFLAEIYEIKQNYEESIGCYEKAYYLNLGRYGAKNVNTEFYKLKLEVMNEQIDNYIDSNKDQYNMHMNNSINHCDRNMTVQLSYLSNISFNLRKNYFSGNFEEDKEREKLAVHDISPDNNLDKDIKQFKGASINFNYVVTYSKISEPWISSVYKNENETNVFVKNLYFDKIRLSKTLKLSRKVINSNLYAEKNISM